MKADTKKKLLTLGGVALAGAGAIALLNQNKAGNRSANVAGLDQIDYEKLRTEILKDETAVLKLVRTIKGDKGDIGEGLGDLITTSIPFVLANEHEAGTVVRDGTEFYLVVQNAAANTAITDPKFLKIYGVNYAGPKGDKGDKGDQGVKGEPGLNSPNFGGSLMVNGAGEFNNLSGWPSTAVIENYLNGLPIIKITSVGNNLNSSTFYVNINRIYKINVNIKTTNNVTLFLQRLDINLNGINEFGNVNVSMIGNGLIPNTESLQNRTFYFNSKDNSNKSFGNNMVKSKLNVFNYTNTSETLINSLIISEVQLSESVPSNLPWLPTGQEVFDPTTGDRGRYNGTSIDWYQMI
jgi:hypothetical protein